MGSRQDEGDEEGGDGDSGEGGDEGQDGHRDSHVTIPRRGGAVEIGMERAFSPPENQLGWHWS